MTQREKRRRNKTPLSAADRGVCTREELTQTQLEDQHFSFAGKSEIDIQAHTVRLFSESRGDFAQFGFHATGFSVSAASVCSASARFANTRL